MKWQEKFFFFLSCSLFFTGTCCESRISYGLSGHHQCKLVYCSPKKRGLKAIIRLHRNLSAPDMMGMNCPCKLGGLIPLTNIAALIPSMTHFCSQLSSGRGKHACWNKGEKKKIRCSISLAGGGSVIGMTTNSCIVAIRSLTLKTEATGTNSKNGAKHRKEQ